MSETEQNPTSNDKTFVSTLHRGRERFLAHVIEKGFEVGTRTAGDFIRHFSPAMIMLGLEKRPALRAKILIAATGVREKIAAKKTAKSSGEDLQIALDERETDPETIVANIDPDDRVRYLDAVALWSYIIEPKFWEVSSDDRAAFERSKYFVAFLLDRALTDELLTHGDIIDAITVKTLAELLPRKELELVIASSLRNGRSAKPFTDADFFSDIPSTTMVDHIPLPLIWNQIIVPLVANAHGFTKQEDVVAEKREMPTEDELSDEIDTALNKTLVSEAEADKPDRAQQNDPQRAEDGPKESEEATPYSMRLARKKIRGLINASKPENREEEPAEAGGANRRDHYSEEPTTVSAFKSSDGDSDESGDSERDSVTVDVDLGADGATQENRPTAAGGETPRVRKVVVPKPAPPPLPFKR